MSDWHEDVYRPSEFPAEQRQTWEKLEAQIIARDRRICQACRKKFRKTELTVHHIIPREEGGRDDPVNLLTLCVPCHNYVELSMFRSWSQIIDSTRDLNPFALIPKNTPGPGISKTKDRPNVTQAAAEMIRFNCPACEMTFVRDLNRMREKAKRQMYCRCGGVAVYLREGDEIKWTVYGVKPT